VIASHANARHPGRLLRVRKTSVKLVARCALRLERLVEEVMMGLNANLAKRVFLAAMLSGLSACVGQGVEGSEDDYADGASESETESETELGSASAALNGTQAAVLNGVYTIIDSDTCLGGANNGRACTANANCPGGTCSLGAQRCTQGPADKIGDKCTYHHQCGAGGFCYTQGTKLFSAETGAGFSLRMANFSSVKVVIANPSSGRYKVEHGTPHRQDSCRSDRDGTWWGETTIRT
jgi:hypothetical protein